MAPSLCERLAYSADSRLLIVNADDFGMCHAVNRATIEGLELGVYTSSTIMVPCPWFPEAVKYGRDHPRADLGVHLTQTSEWETLRWGPVAGRSSVPTLVDERGHFFRDVASVYRNSTLDEVERESRAQIEQALAAGIDVTHFDSHMGTMHMSAAHHEIYVRLAAEYRVPLRVVPRAMLAGSDFDPVLALMDRHGVLMPDTFFFDGPPTPADTADFWNDRFETLPPGVSEVIVHAGSDDAELRGCCPAWEQRATDHLFFTSAPTQARLHELGIHLVGYRALRDAQRAAA